ncbi:MAG TPA: hypothetical protein VIE87_04595 [Pseudolabrys sp.]
MFNVVWDYWGWFAVTYIKPFHDEILAAATAIIALYTIVLACIARKQTKDSRIINRAYLSVEPRGIKYWPSDESKYLAYIAIRNVGHLIAKDVRWWIKMAPNVSGELKDFVFKPAEPMGSVYHEHGNVNDAE